MYAFHCFFQRKTLYINCVHNRIFPKIWGGQMHYWPPRVKSGGPWPPGPPCGGPHDTVLLVSLLTYEARLVGFCFIKHLLPISDYSIHLYFFRRCQTITHTCRKHTEKQADVNNRQTKGVARGEQGERFSPKPGKFAKDGEQSTFQPAMRIDSRKYFKFS